MKKTTLIVTLIAAIFTSQLASAQAFEKGGKYLNVNLGAAQMWYMGGTYFDGWRGGYFGYSPVTGQLGLQMEFGVHEYVGVGFTTGLGFGAGLGSYYYGGYWGRTGYAFHPEVNIPIGAIVNFHFYQLIADKVSKDIHADKLDIYAGLNVGTGPAILLPRNSSGTYVSALFFVGPQVGVRYYFNDKVSINGELGYGKSFFNAGVTFKL